MTALNWIKAKATKVTDEPIEVEGVVYHVTRLTFSGKLPSRMIAQVVRHELVKTDFQNETININTRNNCVEYNLTTYRAAA